MTSKALSTDDTQIIIDGSENSIKTSINILNEFSKISGLKVNLNKSELIPLGHSKVEYTPITFRQELK
jgi:predicted methyltransferase